MGRARSVAGVPTEPHGRRTSTPNGDFSPFVRMKFNFSRQLLATRQTEVEFLAPQTYLAKRASSCSATSGSSFLNSGCAFGNCRPAGITFRAQRPTAADPS